MMPQCEGEPCIEDDAASDVRLGGQESHFVHHCRGIARIVKERPRRVLAEGLNGGDRVGWVERAVQDGRVAEQDVKLDQNPVRKWPPCREQWARRRRRRERRCIPGSPD